MIKIFKIYFYVLFLFFCFSFFPFYAVSKNIVDVIKEDPELSIFYSNLKKTGLDEVLQKKLPWKWTIFAPTDKAFKASPERVQKEILSNEFYNKSIMLL